MDRGRLKNRRLELGELIQQAEQEGNSEALANWQRELSEVLKKIKQR